MPLNHETSELSEPNFDKDEAAQDYDGGLLHVVNRFQGQLPQRIWHYTSLENFKLILRGQSLLFSHLADFSDKAEVIHALNITQLVLDYRLENKQSQREGVLLQAAKAQMIKQAEKSGWYASSLTDSENDPYHWKHYGDECQGVSIGFDFPELIRYLSPSPTNRLFPAQILYDLKKSYEFAGCIVEFGIHYFNRDFSPIANDTKAANEFLELYGKLADPFSIIVKKAEFSIEKEWRLGRHISSAVDGDRPLQYLDSKRRWLLTRGIASDAKSSVLPITKVIIGNRCKEDIRKIRKLLNQSGHNSADLSPFPPNS